MKMPDGSRRTAKKKSQPRKPSGVCVEFAEEPGGSRRLGYKYEHNVSSIWRLP